MDHEFTPDQRNPHCFKFSPQESEIVAATYREHIYNLVAYEGTPSSTTEQDERFAEFNGHSQHYTNNPLQLIEKLEEFEYNTSLAVDRIPIESGVPAFRNTDIIKRRKLGKEAAKLALEMRSKTGLLAADDIPEGCFNDLNPSDFKKKSAE